MFAEQQRDHRRDEQVHVGKVAAVTLVFDHELGRINMDQEANKRNDQNHHERERIQIKSDLRLEAPDTDPGPENLCVSVARRRGGYEADRDQSCNQGGESDGPHAHCSNGSPRQT